MSSHHILLVEDTIILADMVMETIRRIPDIDCTHVASGVAAIEFLSAYRPDLILLDLNLPGKSGWQVMEFITEQYGKNAIKVIVMTAQSDGANRLVGKLQDVERYMIKPIAPRDMIHAICEILEIDMQS